MGVIRDIIVGFLLFLLIGFFGVCTARAVADEQEKQKAEKGEFVTQCIDLGGDITIVRNGKMECNIDNKNLKEEYDKHKE